MPIGQIPSLSRYKSPLAFNYYTLMKMGAAPQIFTWKTKQPIPSEFQQRRGMDQSGTPKLMLSGEEGRMAQKVVISSLQNTHFTRSDLFNNLF